MKLAVEVPAATAMAAGTVKSELVFPRVTLAPPDGAAFVKVTVQVLDPFGYRVPWLQASEDTCVDATRLRAAVCELPLYVAVRVAPASALIVDVVAENVADAAPAATVTVAGMATAALVVLRETAAPPDGAALLKVTVQVAVAELPSVDGVHESAETVGSAAPPVTVPPVPELAMVIPVGETDTMLVMPTDVLVRPIVMVRLMAATAPLAMAVEFIPETMQV